MIFTSTILLPEEPIAGRVQTQNMGFILFLACFFILIYQVGKNSKLLLAMANKLFENRNQTASDELFDYAGFKILLLCIQTILLTSTIIYCVAVNNGVFPVESPSGLYLFLGYAILLQGIFIGYKYLTYSFIAYLFFNKEDNRRWKNTLSSSICASGIVLFFPALILFYARETYSCGIYFVLIYAILVQIALLYRQFVLFFNEKGGLLYFILYLCAQEIIPLFLLYKGFVYLFSMQKGTLWTQI
ncbi:MAG: DUF4271 domain-containing protein [Dysgonamonadaceae bacterium]|jgi:hypothetical protein|nr:DUF4271 domain-containing protein [Dysgonamonadaceae bacterium]